MVVSNSYCRDEKWSRELDGSGVSVIADMHQLAGNVAEKALYVGITFEVQERRVPSQDTNGDALYRYGFERSFAMIETKGCTISVEGKLSVKAPITLEIVSSTDKKNTGKGAVQAGIGATLKGLIPWLKVHGDVEADYSVAKTNQEETSKKQTIDVYSLRPTGRNRWRLEGWGHAEGFLDGELCGASGPICRIQEAEEDRTIEVSIVTKLSDLRAERIGSSDTASSKNRAAVATALLAKALKRSEKIDIVNSSEAEFLSHEITTARTRLCSVDRDTDNE